MGRKRDQAVKAIIRQLLAEKGAPIRVRDLKHLFPGVNTASILALIDEYPNNFERYQDGQGWFVELKTNISVCQSHCSKRTCNGQIPFCSGLHVCKFYILSKCQFTGSCAFGHDLTTTHNKRLLQEHFLEDVSPADICFLLRNSDSRSDVLIPNVCKFYNVQTGCQKKNCSNLHVCKHYIQGDCKFRTGCRRSHNLTDSTVQNILQRHGIDTRRSPKEILDDLQRMMGKAADGTDRTGSSSAGRLTMNDEEEINDPIEHVRLRTAQRNQSRSQANLAYVDQGARPKTAQRNQSRSQANLAYEDEGARPKTGTVGNKYQAKRMGSKAASVPNLQHAISMERESNNWICMYNLCGTCVYKQRCFNAHYDLPYQWMYKSHTSHQWKVFGVARHNHELEITYCDPQNAQCFLDFGEDVIWDVDFKTMTTKGGKYEVQRLSTKSSSEDELHPLATLWKWYWVDQMGNWREYGESDRGYKSSITSSHIEQEYLARPTGQMVFATQGHEYVLDFQEMVQKNISYETQREVVRRPVFVDEQTFQQKKRSACNRKKVSAPLTWGDVEGDLMDHCQIVSLRRKNSQKEFSEIERLFFKSMPNTFTITSIERVENGDLWLSFLNILGLRKIAKHGNMSKKKKMEKRNPTKDVKELQLFHGTSSEYYQAICRQGFDFRLSGTSTGNLYGKGSYFAETAKYSDAYAKSSDRLMFVVRVLVGEYTRGESNFVRPPSKDPSNRCSDLYDSCVDNVSNPKIFVIFDNNGQVYPEYVIKYTNSF